MFNFVDSWLLNSWNYMSKSNGVLIRSITNLVFTNAIFFTNKHSSFMFTILFSSYGMNNETYLQKTKEKISRISNSGLTIFCSQFEKLKLKKKSYWPISLFFSVKKSSCFPESTIPKLVFEINWMFSCPQFWCVTTTVLQSSNPLNSFITVVIRWASDYHLSKFDRSLKVNRKQISFLEKFC